MTWDLLWEMQDRAQKAVRRARRLEAEGAPPTEQARAYGEAYAFTLAVALCGLADLDYDLNPTDFAEAWGDAVRVAHAEGMFTPPRDAAPRPIVQPPAAAVTAADQHPTMFVGLGPRDNCACVARPRHAPAAHNFRAAKGAAVQATLDQTLHPLTGASCGNLFRPMRSNLPTNRSTSTYT